MEHMSTCRQWHSSTGTAGVLRAAIACRPPQVADALAHIDDDGRRRLLSDKAADGMAIGLNNDLKDQAPPIPTHPCHCPPLSSVLGVSGANLLALPHEAWGGLLV
jgi:hypothetical protein